MTTGIVLVASLAARTDQIDIEMNQLGDQAGEAIGVTVGRAIFNDEILPLDVSEVSHRLPEGTEICRIQVGRNRLQHADAPDFRRLLRSRHHRPRRRAAEPRDEIAPPHRPSPG
jgi:hypothetical protein